MGTEETKDTVPSRDKQTPADASVTTTSKTTTTTTSDLKIEGEEENIIIAPKNQQQSLVPTSANDVNSDTNIQEYSERTTLVKEEEEEEREEDHNRILSVKARRAEEALSDLLDSLGTKAEATVRKKFGELDKALDHNYTSAVLDSSKIKELGPMVKEIAETFEDTMTMIEKAPYEEQIILFKGYKKLVEEQIKIVDSRIDMTERLK